MPEELQHGNGLLDAVVGAGRHSTAGGAILETIDVVFVLAVTRGMARQGS